MAAQEGAEFRSGSKLLGVGRGRRETLLRLKALQLKKKLDCECCHESESWGSNDFKITI